MAPVEPGADRASSCMRVSRTRPRSGGTAMALADIWDIALAGRCAVAAAGAVARRVRAPADVGLPR